MKPDAADGETALRPTVGGLVDLVAASEQPVVLVVDQFEQTFTLYGDDGERQAFVETLVQLVCAPGRQDRVILTVRTNFEDYVVRLPSLHGAFEGTRVQVSPLSASELREAIERPADQVGLRFEEGLVEALVGETLGEPAGLPLLQFTLLKLWERRARNRIT